MWPTRELGDLAGKPQIISQGPWNDRNFEVVNAGEKMYQRAGVKLHHRGVQNAPPEGFLLHDKQDEKRIASSANVPRDVERCLTKRTPVASINPAAGPSSPSES
jgi:hypothetical protein